MIKLKALLQDYNVLQKEILTGNEDMELEEALEYGIGTDNIAESDDSNNVMGTKKKKRPGHVRILSAFEAMMQCSSTDDLLELVLDVSAAVDLEEERGERGSISRDKKTKSLSGRWMEKSGCKGDNSEMAVKEGEYTMERDVVLECKVKLGRGKSSRSVAKIYRVLGVYDKSYNKWWMTGKGYPWSPSMEEAKKKEFKLAVRMMEDGALTVYEDVTMTSNEDEMNISHICRIIDGTDIERVLGKYVASGM